MKLATNLAFAAAALLAAAATGSAQTMCSPFGPGGTTPPQPSPALR